MTEVVAETRLNTAQLVADVLSSIDREREREIISRRFGLFDRRETLEQIGEMLGITRERVRQLEKSVINKLAVTAKQNKLPHIVDFQQTITKELKKSGEVARISAITSNLIGEASREEQARIAFMCQLCPELAVIADDDHFYNSAALGENANSVKTQTGKVVAAIKTLGVPESIAVISKTANIGDDQKVAALASISKDLATLNNRWGLVKWPMVNPKNIRDKIYVILKEGGRHMHFNDIAAAIKGSDFKRKDVTTQAIHNELIKDKRFVLIGRGIYALKEWGYESGTVADIISEILKEANKPLHRDEIVKLVLKSRFVKETTILLNLQGKPQFKRVAKATYALADEN